MEAAGNRSHGVEYQILSKSEAEKGLNEPVNWWSQQFPNGTVNRQINYPQTYAISAILTTGCMMLLLKQKTVKATVMFTLKQRKLINKVYFC